MPNYYRSGLGAVGAYQVSGRPYITGSNNALAAGAEDTITFPSVTRTVTVINTDVDSCDIHVHFNTKTNTNVSGGMHFVSLNSLNDAMTFATKCKEIYVSNPDASEAASYTVMAELTGISPSEMFILTGSGLTD